MNNIISELWDRFKTPWHSNSFVMYFVVFIVLIGGCGVYPSIYLAIKGNPAKWWVAVENILTYSAALSFPACLLILQSVYETKKKVGLYILIFAFIVLTFVLIFLTYDLHCSIFAIIFLLIAWFVWVIGNYNNGSLDDDQYEKAFYDGAAKNAKGWDYSEEDD